MSCNWASSLKYANHVYSLSRPTEVNYRTHMFTDRHLASNRNAEVFKEDTRVMSEIYGGKLN